MKTYIKLLALFSVLILNAQGVDIVPPQQASFSAGQNIEGWIQSSVNEPTGKVTFSVPVTSIAARGVSYSIALSYNGAMAFKAGSYHNKFMPSGPVGVGFSMNIPKIVADYKNTATREDDTFYLADGTSNSKLICTGKIDPGNLTGYYTWEFTPEQHSPMKIKYIYAENVSAPIPTDPFRVVKVSRDYWVITDTQGADYYYGQTQNAKENVVAWGNWIGNSTQTGGRRHTVAWNLSKIQDQWSNNLQFEYELQESTVGGVSQTEASYLKKITSSTGEKVELEYVNYGITTFYEPHKEKSEPDAYQEHYQKFFLRRVKSYNDQNELKYTYDFRYQRVNNNDIYDQKQYLQSVIQENADGNFLPSQSFEYYTSGTYKGGLRKVNYPTGGSITYTYENKQLFNNNANIFNGGFPNTSGYVYHSLVAKDNYVLMLYRSNNVISEGKNRFKVIRYWWNGKSWDHHSYILPYLIKDNYPTSAINGGVWLENFQGVFGDDYYGFLYQDGNGGKVDLFHLKSDGRSWEHLIDYPRLEHDKPNFMGGKGFVAIGTRHHNYMYTYTWDKKTYQDDYRWQRGSLYLGSGEFFYGAANNYILILNENGGTDRITGNSHEDNYYIHYLDQKRNWQTKSWSAYADPYIAGIEKPSFFYPENSMSGFVADDNPELFLRWDTNYNLIAVDNKLGRYDDSSPLIPTYTGLYTLQHPFYQYPYRYARFNGSDWSVSNPPDSYGFNFAKPVYGEDFIFYQSYRGARYVGNAIYNPNTNAWSNYTNWISFSSNQNGTQKLSGYAKDFSIAGNSILRTTNQYRLKSEGTISDYDNKFTYSDGYENIFTELSISGNLGRLYYIDKKTDAIENVDFSGQYHTSGPTLFAGNTPFMSPKSLVLRSDTSLSVYRKIEQKTKNQIKDIVVSQVEIDNDNGEKRYISYTYNDPQPTPGNEATYYQNVIVENKGFGNNSNGTIHKKFDTGAEDLRRAGLLLEERVKNTVNGTKSISQTKWNVSYQNVSYSVKPSETINTTYYGGSPMSTTAEYFYNTEHQLPYLVKKTNSKNQIEEVRTTFAYEQYNFMADNNFITQPYELVSTIDGNTVSVERTKWVNINGKIYAKEVFSGTTESTLRKTNEVTRMNTNGQLEESTNGKNQYNAILYGYNYKYPVATISNATYAQVTNALDVSVSALQTLNNTSLKTALLKLYDNLPNAMVTINLYDDQGRIVETLNERKYPSKVYYDEFGRMDYTVDHNDKVLSKNVYHLKTEGE